MFSLFNFQGTTALLQLRLAALSRALRYITTLSPVCQALFFLFFNFFAFLFGSSYPSDTIYDPDLVRAVEEHRGELDALSSSDALRSLEYVTEAFCILSGFTFRTLPLPGAGSQGFMR